MKVKHRWYGLACLVILFITTVINGYHTLAQKLDLLVGFDFSHHIHSKDFYTDLNGEWYFFERELLTPSETKAQISHGMGKSFHFLIPFRRKQEI